MPVITVNGNNLYYETYGLGQPLIFIHGFAVDHLVFSGLSPYFQENFQVFLIDNRGSGQSDCPEGPYTVAMMAEDIKEFCRILNLGPCHFLGHSLGGMILQHLVYHHPQQVQSAIFCNTATKLDIRYALVAKARVAFLRAQCPPRSIIENALGWTFSTEFLEKPGMVDDIINLRLSNPYPITLEGYENQLNALLNFDSQEWVSKIKSRVLVMGSDEDIIIHERSTRKLADTIPNARYHSIKGVGHAPFIEKPEEFCRILNDFLGVNTFT